MSDLVLIESFGNDRGHTASWLLALADEARIDRRLIRTHRKGFLVPRALYAVIAEPTIEGGVSPVEKLADSGNTPEPVEPLVDDLVLEYIPVPEPEPEPDRETVREWAKASGIQVAERGQLKRSLYVQYAEAHAVDSGPELDPDWED